MLADLFPDGVRRVIPKAVFDGAGGDFLKKLGFGPDDPHNLVVTQQLADARLDARRAGQEKILKAINSQLPGDWPVCSRNSLVSCRVLTPARSASASTPRSASGCATT